MLDVCMPPCCLKPRAACDILAESMSDAGVLPQGPQEVGIRRSDRLTVGAPALRPSYLRLVSGVLTGS